MNTKIRGITLRANIHFYFYQDKQSLVLVTDKELLINEGQHWLEKRRILQPKLSKKIIESLHHQLESTTESFLLKHKNTQLDLQAFLLN